MEQITNTEREMEVLSLHPPVITDVQRQIYEGLNAIRPEVAELFLDGLHILNSNLKSKSYLLAHILREVEGGLRDVFCSNETQEELQKKLSNHDIRNLYDKVKEDYQGYEYLKDITFKKFKKSKNHISSILVAFGYSMDHPLSIHYIKIAIWLHKYAHRGKDYSQPRDPKDIMHIWNEFEIVLYKLLGNYFAIVDRLDAIVRLEEPTVEVLRTLPNIFKVESRYVYFFNHLQSPKWLPFLIKEKHFDGGRNPSPVEDPPGSYITPFWPVLLYLQKVSSYNKEFVDAKTTNLILNIIDDIMEYVNVDGSRVENYHTDYSVFKMICDIPEHYLEDRHFDYIQTMLYNNNFEEILYSYNEFLENLITWQNKELLFKGLRLLLEFYHPDKYSHRIEPIFGEQELQRLIQKHKESLIDILNDDLVQYAFDIVKQVLLQSEYAFSISTIPAIEDHAQTWNPSEYECQLVYLIRDCLERLEGAKINGILIKLLKEEHPVYKRLVIHTFNLRYDELHDLFWKTGLSTLDLPSCKHEIYELLKRRAQEFTMGEIHEILNWIETRDYYIHESLKNDPPAKKRHIIGGKKEWLTALLSTESEVVQKKWAEFHAINPIIFDHPGFDSWIETKFGNESPIGPEELANMDPVSMISYFRDFESKDKEFFGPDMQGLVAVLKQVIIDNPNKLNIENNPIVTASSAFKYSWILGISELWKKNVPGYQWDLVLNTIVAILNRDEFWDSENRDDFYEPMFLSNILSFLIDGLQDDTHALGLEQLPVIKEILFTILEKDVFQMHKYPELNMTVLNSIQGRCYMALLHYSLRLARTENKDNFRWDPDVKSLLSTKILEEKENPLLFFVLGQFLPNILYLDECWLLENFNTLFPLDNKSNWGAAMQGYFTYNQLNFNLCQLFLSHGHFSAALNENVLLDNKLNYILNHICSAFLLQINGFEVESEMIQKIVESDQIYIYHSIQNFFSENFVNRKEYKDKVQSLWMALYDKAQRWNDENIDEEILSGCCKWLKNVNGIDSVMLEILMNSVGYVSGRDRYSLMNSLSVHVNGAPEEVGKILLYLCDLKWGYLSRTILQPMVETLYKQELKEIADKICLITAENGIQYLRPVYNKYNNNI